MPKKKINWAEFTCPECGEKGHGRGRCPVLAAKKAGGDGAGGFDTADTGAGGGGWDAPTNTGSAPSEWETARAADAFGGAAAGDGW